MFELKKGMKVKTNFKEEILCFNEIDKDDRIWCSNILNSTSNHFLENKDIDWEETAKLNGIPYDSRPTLEEVTKGINTVFINKYEDLPSLEEVEKEMENKQFAHKHDKGKLQWNLLPINEVEEIVKVLDYGLQKYGKRDCWKLVENPKFRYENALYRHLVEYLKGNKIDEESGLSHLSHLVTNGLFLMWFENNKD